MNYVLIAKRQRRNEAITKEEKNLRVLRGKSNNRRPGKLYERLKKVK